MKLWAITVTLEVVHCLLKTESTISLESSRTEAWVNMELRTSTLELVATIGSGSKTTSTQPQESQLMAVAQTEAAVAEMTSTKDVLIQILTQMETLSLMVLMVALSMHKIHNGAEATTPKSSCPDKCAVLAMVVIAAKVKKKIQLKKIQLKKKIMEKRNKTIQLQVNALTQMLELMDPLSLMVLMVALSMQQCHLGVETTTPMSSCPYKCAVLAMAVIAAKVKKKIMK